MKYILFILLVGGIAGCNSWYKEDTRMSREGMLLRIDSAVKEGWRCLAIKNFDSAFYFQGRMEALFEAAYNEKPSTPSPIKP